MKRLHKTLLLLSVAALPAGAHSFFKPADELCFVDGATAYRLSGAAAADYRIKMAATAADADLRVQLVTQAEAADLVIADDLETANHNSCRGQRGLKTVAIETGQGKADVTVHLSADPAAPDYRIYVHSARFSPADAAALMAAMWKSAQKRALAERR